MLFNNKDKNTIENLTLAVKMLQGRISSMEQNFNDFGFETYRYIWGIAKTAKLNPKSIVKSIFSGKAHDYHGAVLEEFEKANSDEVNKTIEDVVASKEKKTATKKKTAKKAKKTAKKKAK